MFTILKQKKGEFMTENLELQDILGTCTVAFKQRVANLIKFGNKGRFLMIRKNAELDSDFKVTEYKTSIIDLPDKNLETKIKHAYFFSPAKIIVFEFKTTFASIIEELSKIKFDWFCSLDADNQMDAANYAKEKEIFGLVYNQKSDSKWVVSVNNPGAELADDAVLNGSSVLEGLDLLPIIGGLCAGCPYDMSITGFVIPLLKSVEMPEEIIEGQLTLYNEEEGVRVASPVNTLVTTSKNNTEDMKSITIMEGIKRFDTDVKYAFRTGYKGKFKNKYDNQQLFVSAGKGFIRELEKADILDEEYNNNVFINTARMRELWIASGKSEEEVNSKSDLEIMKLSYKKLMCLKFDVKFLDAIEACEIDVEMY